MRGKKPPTQTDISTEERELFRSMVGEVTPLSDDRIVHRPRLSRRKSRIQYRPPAQGVDIEPHLAPEDVVFFHRGGLPQKQLRKFKRGEMAIEARLDLHGQTGAEALSSLQLFFTKTAAENKRSVLIIHGKGYRSQGAQPILKSLVHQWLQQQDSVIAFCSAQPHHGGNGAVYVLVQRCRL
ncbi:MAG: Smr/MutS family protein [Pseudomonadota bacterium]